MQIRSAVTIRSLLLSVVLATSPGVAFSQSGAASAPSNSHANLYGRGWECDYGYREVARACTAVKVPADAHAVDSTYGLGWKCDRNFREVKETCIAVEVPSNAYPVDSLFQPRGWECNRGYRLLNESCVAVQVPAHAFST